MTSALLKEIWEMRNAKAPLSVLETPFFFFLQYPSKPVIIIDKRTGRLLALKDGFSRHEQEKQAGFVIRMLKKFDLVEKVFHKRITLEEWKKKSKEKDLLIKSKVYKRKTQKNKV